MAAGAGFKTWATGDVLTAIDVNEYLMQGVWVFDDAADRTSQVTAPAEGNVSFLKDTNSMEYYDGSAWVAVAGGGSSYFGNVLATGTLSGASLDLQSISQAYTDLVLDIENPYAASSGMLKLRINNESGAASHGYMYTKSNDGSLQTGNSTEIQLGVYAAASNNSTSFIRIIIPNYSTGTHRPVINFTGTDTVDTRAYLGQGYRINNSAAVNRLTVYVTSVNFSGGTYTLYGVN